MADRLTQLQDCLDQLATQMYATLSYTSTRAASAPIPGQPLQSPAGPGFPSSAQADAAGTDTQTQTQTQAQAQTQTTTQPSTHQTQPQTQPSQPLAASSSPQTQTQTQLQLQSQPQTQSQHSPTTAFTADLHELARDLIVKEQQIEYLIARLPGIGTSERAQRARIAALERQLREVEAQRVEAVREKERLLERVAGRIGGVRGV
ncbi:CSE2-domain-containing protein [Glonium stellatum]|uniref:Mediator of RNA polymerase II transcription subunit 21 n=1 Tax=Glonium stellatum TaxID=574774 RepID=A0A8E2F7E1_9PEZI|nr:CSE2-domain-containing protein [Glonium stellatum]